MKRGLLNFLTALSMLLCGATGVLWVRSYWVADHFWLLQRSGGAQLLRTAQGDIEFMAQRTYYIDVSSGPRLSGEHAVGTYLGVSDPADYPRRGKWLFVRWGSSPGPPAPNAEQLQSDRETLRALAGAMPKLRERADAGDRDAALLLAESEHRVRSLLIRPGHRWSVHLPAWVPAALSALLPALWLRRAVRLRSRRRPGHCVRCGYDLRATPGRCPECGMGVAIAEIPRPAGQRLSH